jgi:hypothetical protein
MGPADGRRSIDTDENGHCPSNGYDDQTTGIAFGPFKYHIRNNPVTKYDDKCRAYEFCKKFGHAFFYFTVR